MRELTTARKVAARALRNMSESYQFDAKDRALVEAAATLLKKVAFAEITTPAQLVSIAKLQHVLSALPRVTPGVEVSVSVTCPRRTFGDIETMNWWDVGVEQGRLSDTAVRVAPLAVTCLDPPVFGGVWVRCGEPEGAHLLVDPG